MTLNEILLIVVAMTILVIIPSILKRIKQPLNTYITLTSELLLLILVWFFTDNGSLPIKVIMTLFVIASAIKSIKDYKESCRIKERENN